MRRSLSTIAALAMTAAIACTAYAQGPGRGRGGMFGRGGGLGLLRYPTVQKELKMSPDQITKLDTEQQTVRQQQQDLRSSAGDFQSMSAEDRAKLFEKMQDIQNKAVADVLTPDQMGRFHQLELQQMGPAAFNRKEVADKLQLTDDEKASIKDIQQKSMADMRAAMQGQNFQDMTPDERAAMRTKMEAAQKATNDKILGVLTADQRQKWADMQGAKFDFGPPPQRQRPGGQSA